MLRNDAQPPKFITITSVRTRANLSYEYDGIYPKNILNQIRFKTITVPEANILRLVKTADDHYVYHEGLPDSYAVEVAVYDTEFSTALLFTPWAEPGANAGGEYDAEAAAMEASIQASSETQPHPAYYEGNSNESNSYESNSPEDPQGHSNNENPKPHGGRRRKQKRTRRRFKKSATRKRK